MTEEQLNENIEKILEDNKHLITVKTNSKGGKKDEAISHMKSIIGSSKDLPDYKLEKERYWIDEAYKFLRKNGVELA